MAQRRGRPIFGGNVQPRPFAGTCCWPECDDNTDLIDAPLCKRHLFRAHRIFRATYMWAVDDAVDGAFAKAAPTPKLSGRQGCIYFVRFQGLVKIGFTTNMASRMVAVPHEEILGTVPGTLADEKRCHAAFAHLRKQGEWFRPEPELLAFIAEVAA